MGPACCPLSSHSVAPGHGHFTGPHQQALHDVPADAEVGPTVDATVRASRVADELALRQAGMGVVAWLLRAASLN